MNLNAEGLEVEKVVVFYSDDIQLKIGIWYKCNHLKKF